jgi:uncharacterized membrane protein YphA (DoxX/SURF4 family)
MIDRFIRPPITPEWLFGDGAPVEGMVGGAIASEGTPGWYAWFLENVVQPNAGLFATLVALGELAVGLGLLVGLLTGIAAFGGVFMNANFVLAGALGSNPALHLLGTLLVLAWRNAGWIGLDRWFLPLGPRAIPGAPAHAAGVAGGEMWGGLRGSNP